MFERFTDKARAAVVLAQEQAREQRAGTIRSEHLLLALFAVPDNLARTVLEGSGVTRDELAAAAAPGGHLGPADAEALATLGIDLDRVRRQVEDAFGPGALERTGRARWRAGHIPFDRTAKRALAQALREALRLRHNYIGTEHLLLGLLHGEGTARTILGDRGIRLEAMRVVVAELVRGRRAG